MCSIQPVISDSFGLQNKKITTFVRLANTFRANIWLEGEDTRKVNAKSLLGVIALGVKAGSSVRIYAAGPDENEAIVALSALLT